MDFLYFLKNNKLVLLVISILLNILLLISTSILIILYTNKDCQEKINIPNDKEILLSENSSLTNNEEDESKDEENTSDTLKEYYVEIKGAVVSPGVYLVNDNLIINDVIKMAGGLNKDAYTDNINLSYHLKDEMVIYVYTKSNYQKNKEEIVKEENTNSTCICPSYDIHECTDNYESIITPEDNNNEDIKDNTNANKEDNKNTNENIVSDKTDAKVNINTASLNELMTLSGIGESKAQDIIAYRSLNGLFKSIEDIKKVNGIKDATYNKIKDHITV